jgi:PadR family transcriptional regulator
MTVYIVAPLARGHQTFDRKAAAEELIAAPRVPLESPSAGRLLQLLAPPATLYCMVRPRPQDELLAQLRRGVLEYCVLALLRHDQRYGFEIVHTLADQAGLVTSEGTIYPLLSRLRRDGAVQTSWRESPSGPPRRYYRITPAGQRALEQFRDEWAQFRDNVDGLLGKGER